MTNGDRASRKTMLSSGDTPVEDRRGISYDDIYHKLGVLEGKVDAAINNISTFKNDLNECEKRISVLEAGQNKMLGIVILIGIILPIGLNVLTDNLKIDMSNDQRSDQIR